MKCKLVTERVNAGFSMMRKTVRDENGNILWACNYDPDSENGVLSMLEYLDRWLAAYPDTELENLVATAEAGAACTHPPSRIYSGVARDDTKPGGWVQWVGCTACGAMLK